MAILRSRRTFSSVWAILSFQWLLSSAQIVVVTSQCSICPFDEVVTLPDAIVPEGTGGVIPSELSCAEVEVLAQGGEFSLGECVILRASGVPDVCGCQAPPDPTASPVDPPTDAVDPTPAPVDTPAPTTTAPVPGPPPPTPAPADTPAPVDAPPPTPAPVEPTDVPTETPDTDAPTAAPDAPTVDAPLTVVPSVAATGPTFSPFTWAPTQEPQPTPVPFPTVLGNAAVRVLTVGPGRFSSEAENGFEGACAAFYNDTITEAEDYVCTIRTFKVLPVPGANRARLMRQRGLQDSTAEINYLDVTVELRGTSKTFEYTPSNAEFSALIIDTLNDDSNAFSDLLRTTGSAESQLYFDDALTVQAYEEGEAPDPTAPPMAVPVTPPTAPTDDDDDDSLSGGAIAGIVLACVVGSVAVVGGAKYLAKSNPEPRPSVLEVGNPTGDFDTTPTTSIAAPTKSQVGTATTAAAATTMLSASQASSNEPEVSVTSSAAPAKQPSGTDPSGIKTASASQISTGLASAQPSEFEDSSAVTGGSDVAGDKDGEDMSYAYSLDAGNMEAQSAVAAGTTGSAAGGGTDGMDKSESGSEMSSHAMSSLRQNMVSRTVVAPPGKLGIVIDTTLEGPVVHRVNPQSPLEGTLFPGDIIVAIDDVDTRAMSASAITALMVRTANLRRKLTVLSEDNTS